MDDCIFCKILKGNPKNIIYENSNFFSILDNKPKVKGHALVISKKHFNTFLDMPVSLGHELLDCIKNTSLILMKQKKSDGVNIVNNTFEAAGQIVNHVHFHVLPRKKGDGFRTSV